MKKRNPKKGERVVSKKAPETSLEKNIKEKIEIISDNKKKPEENDEFMEELDSAGIISSGELRQILKSETRLHQLGNLPISRSLEGGLIFAPRISDSKETGGKIYSEVKYDPKYAGSNYAEKTPEGYAGKESSSKGSENSNSDSRNNGNP